MTVQVSACPPRSELVKLTSGRLPPPDVETLLQHLETCPGCFAQVPELSSAPDTLVELLAKAKTPPPGWRDPIIGSLIARLVKLRKFVEPGPKMLIFPCPACGKNMKAGVEFVGKNLKCPTCARVVVMPPPPAPNLSEKTLPPAVAGTLRVPSGTAHGVCLLQPESGSIIQGVPISENTQVPAVAESFPFLAPAQQLDELGRLSHYRVLKKLGAGGMGVVFLAEDTQLHRKVALKTMLPAFAASPENRERFLREARAAASIEHDHIVAIHHVGEENGVPFLAMPLLKGEPLDARLEREGKLPVADAVRIAAEIAEGLAAAHAARLIHRDIKPGNVWLEAVASGQWPVASKNTDSEVLLTPDHRPLTTSFRVKILDFGLARSQHENVRLTQSGAVLGTPAYMPPEQAEGATVDERGDLFSLGCVLYEMLTGERPFRGENTIALLAALTLQEPTPPHVKNPEVPAAISELTMRLLAKKPAGRPASAGEVARQLRGELLRLGTQQSPAKKVSRERVKKIAIAMGNFAGKAVKHGGGGAGFHAARALMQRPRLAAAVAVASFLVFAWFFGGAVWRVATNRGELVIETDDPNMVVTVKGETVTLYDKVKDRRFVLSAGDYDVEVREEGDGGVRFATKKFTITRGGRETFNARHELAEKGGPGKDGKSDNPEEAVIDHLIEVLKNPQSPEQQRVSACVALGQRGVKAKGALPETISFFNEKMKRVKAMGGFSTGMEKALTRTLLAIACIGPDKQEVFDILVANSENVAFSLNQNVQPLPQDVRQAAVHGLANFASASGKVFKDKAKVRLKVIAETDADKWVRELARWALPLTDAVFLPAVALLGKKDQRTTVKLPGGTAEKVEVEPGAPLVAKLEDGAVTITVDRDPLFVFGGRYTYFVKITDKDKKMSVIRIDLSTLLGEP